SRPALPSFPTRRSSELGQNAATKPFAAIAEDGTAGAFGKPGRPVADWHHLQPAGVAYALDHGAERIEVGDDRPIGAASFAFQIRSEEHTSELQSRENLV